jgi:hypothetical protein
MTTIEHPFVLLIGDGNGDSVLCILAPGHSLDSLDDLVVTGDSD